MIPLKINGTDLCKIFEPDLNITDWTDAEIQSYSISKRMFPTEVHLTSETYSRDAERTADYELEYLTLVNRKAKPTFTWSLIKTDYVRMLLAFLGYKYDFKDDQGIIHTQDAPDIHVTYLDFTGSRTIIAYLGQTLEGTLVEYEGVQYWENFTIAFPER